MNASVAARLVTALEPELAGVAATEAFGDVHVDVPPEGWLLALRTARDALGLTFLDWLSAYDDAPYGFAVVAHLVADLPGDRVLVRTRLPAEAPRLATATGLWPGAAWHERETWEMFGVDFDGHAALDPLLLQPGFEGRPLRKDFVLASRAVKDWPGAKDPTDVPGRPRRRPHLPPGVPTGWGTP